MEPIEINAGTWYLRALRHDDRLSDVPALREAARDPEIRRWSGPGFLEGRPAGAGDVPDPECAAAHVAAAAAGWADETRLSWAVCEPTTGEMLGEIALERIDVAAGCAEASCWALERARGAGMTGAALGAVARFGRAALGLETIRCAAPESPAARRLAERLGNR